MKFGDSRGVKTGKWFPNEMFRDTDINFVGGATYQNFLDMLTGLLEKELGVVSPKDRVVGGLELVFSTAMTASLHAGIAVSPLGAYLQGDVWGFVSDPGSVFGVFVPVPQAVAFDVGGANPRIDLVEIRPIEIEYNSVPRPFKDPVTGLVTTSTVVTRKEYGYEFAVRKGTEAGSPVAPSRTTGWIKIAEVRVEAGASSLNQSKIKDFRDSNAWTTNIDATQPPPEDAGRAISAIVQAMVGTYNRLLTGGLVTKGTGDTLNVSGMRYVAGSPTLVYRTVAGKTNMAIPDAVLDGGTTNYVKLTWPGEIVVNPVGPTNEILLATLVGTSGGAFTIVQQEYPIGSTVAVSADYSIVPGVAVVEVTTGSSDRTISLPLRSQTPNRRIIIRKADSGSGKVIVSRAGSDVINGATTWEIRGQYDSVEVRENGVEWAARKEGIGDSIRRLLANGAITAGRAVFMDPNGKATQDSDLIMDEKTGGGSLTFNNAGGLPDVAGVCRIAENRFAFVCVPSGTFYAGFFEIDGSGHMKNLLAETVVETLSGSFFSAIHRIYRIRDDAFVAVGTQVTTNYPAALVVKLVGTTVTFGTIWLGESVAVTGASVGLTVVADDEFVLLWGTASAVKARYGVVSDTTITGATEGAKTIEAIAGAGINASLISSTSFIAVYINSANVLKGVVCTLSGTGISTVMTVNTIYSSGLSATFNVVPSVAAIGSKAVVVYMFNNIPNINMRVTGLSISGTVITWSSVYTETVRNIINSGSWAFLEAVAYQVNAFQAAVNVGSGVAWLAQRFAIVEIPSGADAVIVGEITPSQGEVLWHANQQIPACWSPEWGFVRAFDAPGVDTTLAVHHATYTSLKRRIVGIALESVSDGQPCLIQMAGIVSGLSGLTAGKNCYVKKDGTLIHTHYQNQRIGYALSANELALVNS